MLYRRIKLFCIFLLFATHFQIGWSKILLGWLEYIEFPELGIVAKAKMDTGTFLSSLHSIDKEYFQKNGEKWVRFILEIENQRAKKKHKKTHLIVERPIERFTSVISSNGISNRRPVVLMTICLGNQLYQEQFTLNDRSHMIYPILIGRKSIEHMGLIDVSHIYTMQQPQCNSKNNIN
ncbi:ATP-dependent zinc protease [Candidatus Nitrosacidococcus sp. I8]|uniref:ATP-dependent zinc protease family protein n=1 Tax=Candidatus Nitrosacidococcus sp. I8 TaxID=2942908 RepID=UPI0022270EE5|nr:ATP-dependent zinc protease [Candidatus Nitrosacidococcus sp. I8]CAH9019738.1 hypothetical protein NURINAE_01716 [Candidatus Nitrosacidococcus sp. I8]